MSQRMERMAGSYVLWLTLASCILTPASTEQQGECSAHLAAARVTCGEAWGREGGRDSAHGLPWENKGYAGKNPRITSAMTY